MTATAGLALVLLSAGIILLRCRLGRMWLRRPVTWLVLAGVVYQGVAAVLAAIPPVGAWDYFRIGIQPGFTDDATLLTSASLLALTCAYLMTQPQRVSPQPSADSIRAAAKTLDWRLLAAACAPLAVLTYEGRGYNSGVRVAASSALASTLASTFFIILTVVTAFALILRRGPRWFLPVLVGQSVLLAAAGERTPVLIDAVALAVMLTHAGIRPSRGHVHAAAALTLLAILAITSTRTLQGRSLYFADNGLGTRVAALGTGVASLADSKVPQAASPGLVAQATTRLDGDAFTGGILEAENLGQPGLSAIGVPESLLLAVPSALWPSKLTHGTDLDPVQSEMNRFGLQDVNFLPGLPGLYAGFLSPPWLVLLMALLGVIFGRAEQWLLRACTPARLILLAGAVTAALMYEQGLPGMLLALRAALVIALAVKVLEVARGRRRAADALRADEAGRPRARRGDGITDT